MAVLKGASSSMLLNVVTTGMALITVPLTVSYLGKEEYGVWMVIVGMMAWMGMVDLGISNSAVNRLSKCYANSDFQDARHCVTNVLAISVAIVAFLGTAAFAAIWAIDWAGFMKLSEPGEGGAVRNAMWIMLAATMVSFIYQPVSKIGSCFRFGHIQNCWSLAATLIGLAALLTAIAMKGGLVTLALAVASGRVLVLLAASYWLFWHKLPAIRPRTTAEISRRDIRSLLSTGSWFFILQLCVIAILQMEPFLIALYLGAAAVGPYMVTARLLALASLVEGAVITYLWPAYAEALERGDKVWIKRALLVNWTVSLGGTLVVCAPLLIWGPQIIGMWAGSEVAPTRSLVFWLAGFRALFALTNPIACLLNATGRIREQVWIALAQVLGIVGLTWYLLPRWGAEGMAASLVIVFSVSLLPFLLLLRSSLKRIMSDAPKVAPATALSIR